jgi:undecaprenyl-diphosphatase
MDLWHAVLLGIVQGLTEFLPISSSGHLVLVQELIKIPDRVAVSFDIVIHLGTLMAVVIYFYGDLKRLVQGIWKREADALRLAWYLILGTLPAVVAGLLLQDYLAGLFGSGRATAWQLIANGLLLLVADRLTGERKIETINSGDALWVGVGQAVGIIPGISRSGATIAAGLFRKLSRQAAARYSFLLSIPVILGAGLFDAENLIGEGYRLIGPGAFWAGLIGSALSGYLVIKAFLTYLQRGTFKFFGYYCLVLGGIALALFGRG